MNLIKWLFKSVGPYIVGILIGVGFAYLLVDLLSNPLSLPGQVVQSVKNGGVKEQPRVAEAPKPIVQAAKKEVAPAPAPVKEVAPAPAPVQEAAPAPAPVKEVAPAPAPAKEAAPAPIAEAAPAPAPMPVMSPPENKLDELAPNANANWNEQNNAPSRQPAQGWNGSGYGQPAAPQIPAEVVAKCGQPPRTPGYAMNRYYSCLWQQQCEARQAKALEMIQRSKESCPKSGPNAQLCQNYYNSLTQQYQVGMCPQWNQQGQQGQPQAAQ